MQRSPHAVAGEARDARRDAERAGARGDHPADQRDRVPHVQGARAALPPAVCFTVYTAAAATAAPRVCAAPRREGAMPVNARNFPALARTGVHRAGPADGAPEGGEHVQPVQRLPEPHLHPQERPPRRRGRRRRRALGRRHAPARGRHHGHLPGARARGPPHSLLPTFRRYTHRRSAHRTVDDVSPVAATPGDSPQGSLPGCTPASPPPGAFTGVYGLLFTRYRVFLCGGVGVARCRRTRTWRRAARGCACGRATGGTSWCSRSTWWTAPSSSAPTSSSRSTCASLAASWRSVTPSPPS